MTVFREDILVLVLPFEIFFPVEKASLDPFLFLDARLGVLV